MSSIRLMFKEGFQNDSVVVRINDKEVGPREPLTTRRDVEPPLAWSVDVPVDMEAVLIQISVPTRNISDSIRLNVKEFSQLDIAVVGDRIEMKPSREVRPSIG